MAQEFEEGYIVKLKSGSPAMTVTAVLANGNLACIWFDKNEDPKEKIFNPNTLKKLS